MRTIATIALLTLLAGCGAQGAAVRANIQADVQQIVAPIQQTTLADAQAAVVIAQASGDQAGVQCFTDIVNYLQNAGPALPAVAGVLSGLEAARTFKGITIPENIHRDCAVIVLDAQQAAIRLGLSLAPVVGGIKVQAGAATLKAEAAALQAAGKP
jgi:hypothetical protein